jgi:arylsulfatase A-like enzyme
MNIILIISDTFRRDHLGCYGNRAIQTPNLNRFADQAVVFERCYAASFPTMPNRADILTGKHTFTYLGWAPLPRQETTLPQLLSQAGYSTAAIVDTPFYIRNGYGYDRGFDNFVWIRGQQPGPERSDVTRNWRLEKDRFAPRTLTTAEQWLEGHRRERFFLLLDTWDPHEPWDPPDHYVEQYLKAHDGRPAPLPCYWSWREVGLSQEDVSAAHAHYCGEITMVDRWIGRMFERLESLGLSEDTAVIFTSDHGFYFGEHGLLGKARLRAGQWHWSPLHDEVARIPLMVYVPGIEPTRVDALVGPPDVMPTILELAGLHVPSVVQGQSMLPMLRGEKHRNRDVSVTSWPLYNPRERTRVIDDLERGIVEPLPSTIRDDEWTLVCATQGQEVELYHTATDPGQIRNAIEENERIASALHAQLIAFLEEMDTEEGLLATRRQLL